MSEDITAENLAELRKDKERLDWLERSREDLFTVWATVKIRKADGTLKSMPHQVFVGWSCRERLSENLSAREAIDTAMLNEEPVDE